MKTIYKPEEFPDTLEPTDSFDTKQTDAVVKYLHKMLADEDKRKTAYAYNALFAFDAPRQVLDENLCPVFGEKVFLEKEYWCHNPLNQGFVSGKTTFLVDVFNHLIDAAVYAPYLEWLYDEKRSPWRDAMRQATMLREKKTNVPVAIVYRNFAEPETIKLQINLAIATRLQSGWALSWLWQHFVQNGLTPAEAAVFSTLFNNDQEGATGSYQVRKKERYYQNFKSIGHCYLNSGDQPFNCEVDVNLLEKGAYFKAAKPSLIQSPNPCNWIWSAKKKLSTHGIHSIETSTKVPFLAFLEKKITADVISQTREFLQKRVHLNVYHE